MSMVLGMIWVPASRAPTLVHITGIGMRSNFRKEGRNGSPPDDVAFRAARRSDMVSWGWRCRSSAPEYGHLSGCGAGSQRWVVGVRSGSASATLICGFRCISLCFSSGCPAHRDAMSVKVPGHLCRSQCLNRGTTTKSAVSPTRRCDISSAKNNDSKAVRSLWAVPAKGGGVRGGVSSASC